MTRLFISQPMRGKTDEEILKVRAEAVQAVKERLEGEVSVVDSFLKTAPANVCCPLWCLGRSLELLAAADVIYFAPGWEKARGCRIEHIAAEEYGIKIIEEERK